MKNIKLSWFGLLAFSLLAVSCSHDDDNTTPVVPSGVVKLPVKITAYSDTDGSNTLSATRITQFKYNTDNSIAEMNNNGEILKFVYDSNSQLTEVDHYKNEASSTIALSEKIIYGTDKIVFREEFNGGGTRDYNIFTNTSARTINMVDAITDNTFHTESLFTYDSKGNMVKNDFMHKPNGVLMSSITSNMTYDNKCGVFSKVKLSATWANCSFSSSQLDIEYWQANNMTSIRDLEGLFLEYTYNYDADGYPIQAKVNGKVAYEFEYKTVSL